MCVKREGREGRGRGEGRERGEREGRGRGEGGEREGREGRGKGEREEGRRGEREGVYRKDSSFFMEVRVYLEHT